jgi:hypothetical protein
VFFSGVGAGVGVRDEMRRPRYGSLEPRSDKALCVFAGATSYESSPKRFSPVMNGLFTVT